MTRSVDNGQLYRPVKWGESPDRRGLTGKPLTTNDMRDLSSQACPASSCRIDRRPSPHPRERQLTHHGTFPASSSRNPTRLATVNSNTARPELVAHSGLPTEVIRAKPSHRFTEHNSRRVDILGRDELCHTHPFVCPPVVFIRFRAVPRGVPGASAFSEGGGAFRDRGLAPG